MTRVVALTFVVVLGMLAIGCSDSTNTPGQQTAVLDVPPTPAPIPPAQPVADSQPVNFGYTPAAQSVAVAQDATPAQRTYTVKKGDTLYSIAKTSYGTGRDWQRIAAANPGVQPSKLRVGQTIVIP